MKKIIMAIFLIATVAAYALDPAQPVARVVESQVVEKRNMIPHGRWGGAARYQYAHYRWESDGWVQLYRDLPPEGYRVVSVVDTITVTGVVEAATFEPIPVEVPQVVTRFRFWLAWYGATGMTHEDVRAVIVSWDDSPTKAQALIAIDNARDFRRDNAFVEMLREQAEMNAEQMDAVFIAADALEVD